MQYKCVLQVTEVVNENNVKCFTIWLKHTFPRLLGRFVRMLLPRTFEVLSFNFKCQSKLFENTLLV